MGLLTTLEALYLKNAVEGTVPTELGQLIALTSLPFKHWGAIDLSCNEIAGPIPTKLGK
jgi:hypothetical protein